MNKACIVIIALLCISTCLLSVEGRMYIAQDTSGPTIDWYDNPTDIEVAWDGIYQGQTEQTFSFEVEVNDTDGIDTVLFRFRWVSESEWRNVTGILKSGNETDGLYQGNFTYAVWWNALGGYPETEGDGGNFYFKVFANDTLGYWSEVEPIRYNGGYDLVIYPDQTIPTEWLLVGAVSVIGLMLVICLVKGKQR